jgi:hypothetical protein
MATTSLATEPSALGFAGRVAIQHLLARPSIYRVPASLPFTRLGETRFREPSAPRAMSCPAARVLEFTIASLDTESERRRRNATQIREMQATSAPWSLIKTSALALPGWLRLPFLASEFDPIPQADAARLGVVPSYPRPLNELEPLRSALVNRSIPLPGASMLSRRLWTLPTHGALANDDLLALQEWIHERGRTSTG